MPEYPDVDHGRTLADALIGEMRRVRDVILPHYLALEGGAGMPAVLLMRGELDAAAYALAEQDATKCLALFRALRAYEL